MFTDKQKLREFSTTKPALQQMLKGLKMPVNTRETKDLKQNKQTNNNNKKNMPVGIYTSIIA